MKDYVHYRGDTFDLLASISAVVNGVSVTDFTGYTVASQIRDPKGALIATLSVQWIDIIAGKVRLYMPTSTADWPLTRAKMNVRVETLDGKMISSSAAFFEIEAPATQ